MNQYLNTLLALILSTTLFPAEARQVYKWVDKDGNVHYGESARQSNVTPLTVTTKRSSSVKTKMQSKNSAQKKQQLLESMQEERIKRRETKAKAKKELQIAKKNCNAAKSNWNFLNNHGRLIEPGANGETHYLSATERAAKIERERLKVTKFCK